LKGFDRDYADGRNNQAGQVYSIFAWLGSVLGSVFLGLLAQSAGLPSVFYATSLTIGIGVILMGRSSTTPKGATSKDAGTR
jgi:sugar phosphate permease